MIKWVLKIILLVLICFNVCYSNDVQSLKGISLPEPVTKGGMPLLTALQNRHSSREFSNKEIPIEIISNLLWAGFGVNREGSKMRTAPSSYNWQDIIIYVFTAKGVWIYDAFENRLKEVKSGDYRQYAGMQEYVKNAPLSLVYVSDTEKMVRKDQTFSDNYKLMMGCIDAGHISQNIYLFCASEGLNVVARASVNKEEFSKEFELPETYNVILGQTIGYDQ